MNATLMVPYPSDFIGQDVVRTRIALMIHTVADFASEQRSLLERSTRSLVS